LKWTPPLKDIWSQNVKIDKYWAGTFQLICHLAFHLYRDASSVIKMGQIESLSAVGAVFKSEIGIMYSEYVYLKFKGSI